MKKQILFTFFFILTSVNISCQKNKEKNINNMDFEFERILKKQLKNGYEYYYVDGGVEQKVEFTEEDINELIKLEKKILSNSDYVFISNSEFNLKIKDIFQRIINEKLPSKYLYVNIRNKCERGIHYFKDDYIDYVGFLVFKNDNFISPLYFIPDIYDYKKKFPNLSIKDGIEKTKEGDIYVSRWMGNNYDNNEEQLLINRNKYLFNDNKASLAWLKVNDSLFLESLVITFGYTKDKDLLDWVMQRNRSKAVEFINNYVFVRNCKGELEIREDILKYIEQKTTDEENTHDYAKALYHYEVYENPNKWTEKEAYKILAYKSNTYDYLFMKYKNIRYNNRWNILGSIYYYSNRGDEKEWKEIEKNFEMNNYYNLPYLKEALEYAYIFE